jgi:anti-sigma factor RsiW
MNTIARDTRIGELLRHLARGGLDDRQRARIEKDLAELTESKRREEQWRRLTRASHQPRLRHQDAYE